MTTLNPKEKANELVNQYFKICGGTNKIQDSFEWERAKQCAHICVFEIMNALTAIPYGLEYLHNRDYYEQVIEEINNL